QCRACGAALVERGRRKKSSSALEEEGRSCRVGGLAESTTRPWPKRITANPTYLTRGVAGHHIPGRRGLRLPVDDSPKPYGPPRGPSTAPGRDQRALSKWRPQFEGGLHQVDLPVGFAVSSKDDVEGLAICSQLKDRQFGRLAANGLSEPF